MVGAVSGSDGGLLRSARGLVWGLLALLCLLGLIAPQGAAAARVNAFKTPSGNIVCEYPPGKEQVPAIVCGIESGLKPPPSRSAPACEHLDYVGNRVFLTATGHARPISCAGDAGPFAFLDSAWVLKYSKSWRGDGFVCTSRTSGLTCRNRRGHGFFLSRAHWHPF